MKDSEKADLLEKVFSNALLHFEDRLRHIEKGKNANRRKKKWLGTSEIYGFFSKDFYDRYYGDMLSTLSHGKGATEIFRIDRTNPQEERIILVPEFNHKYAFSIINHLIPIIYGYLSHWELFFEGRTLPLSSELAKERAETIAWLKEQLQQQPQKHPESTAWAEGIKKIISFI